MLLCVVCMGWCGCVGGWITCGFGVVNVLGGLVWFAGCIMVICCFVVREG